MKKHIDPKKIYQHEQRIRRVLIQKQLIERQRLQKFVEEVNDIRVQVRKQMLGQPPAWMNLNRIEQRARMSRSPELIRLVKQLSNEMSQKYFQQQFVLQGANDRYFAMQQGAVLEQQQRDAAALEQSESIHAKIILDAAIMQAALDAAEQTPEGNINPEQFESSLATALPEPNPLQAAIMETELEEDPDMDPPQLDEQQQEQVRDHLLMRPHHHLTEEALTEHLIKSENPEESPDELSSTFKNPLERILQPELSPTN